MCDVEIEVTAAIGGRDRDWLGVWGRSIKRSPISAAGRVTAKPRNLGAKLWGPFMDQSGYARPHNHRQATGIMIVDRTHRRHVRSWLQNHDWSQVDIRLLPITVLPTTHATA